MKKVYTWTAQPAYRTVTIADLQAQKGSRKWLQVTANSAEEAAAAAEAGFDMMACNSLNTQTVREGDNSVFLTSSLLFPVFATEDEIMTEAFRCLRAGADAIMTARSMDVVHMLAKEDIPVMGHLGLVPRKSTWTGGLRAVGKTASEAIELYHQFKRLEEAGAVLVEAEVIPENVMAEISKRTSLLVVSLGSGSGGDIDYLFMEDITGDTEHPPRHAKAFGQLRQKRQELAEERIRALKAFKSAVEEEEFPSAEQSTQLDAQAFETFLSEIEKPRH